METCNSIASGSNSKVINSFVFMDVETSDLSHLDKPTIIEISLVAVHRNALLLHPFRSQKTDKTRNSFTDHTKMMPRVTDKVTICLDPRKQTSPATYQLTQLDNLNLAESKKEPLNEKVVAMLKLFLSLQESPVCLVAHNGNKFDFPLLKTELLRLTSEDLCESLLCVDSIVAFREDFLIKEAAAKCLSPPRKRKACDKESIPQLSTSNAEVQISDENLQSALAMSSSGTSVKLIQRQDVDKLEPSQAPDAAMLAQNWTKSTSKENQVCNTALPPIEKEMDPIHSASDSPSTVSSDTTTSLPPSHALVSHPNLSSSSSSSSSSKTDKTEVGSELTVNHDLVSSSTSSSSSPIPIHQSSNLVPVSSSHQNIHHEVPPTTPPRSTTAESVLTPPPPPPPSKHPRHMDQPTSNTNTQLSFSLINIFKRTFGVAPPVSHSAEDDALSLIKVILPRARQFVEWADKNAVEFENIGLYYKPRKAKRKLLFPPPDE